MRDKDFIPIFRKMALAYGSRMDDEPETMQVYFELLEDLPIDLVQAAAVEFMASPSAFPPTPGQIRAKAVDLQKRANGVPSPDEAWKMVLDAPIDGLEKWSEEREDGWHIFNQPYQWESALVERVARNLGWPNRFWTDNMTSDRARFLQAYENQLGNATREATSLPQVQAYLAKGPGDIKSITDGFRREALDRGRGE